MAITELHSGDVATLDAVADLGRFVADETCVDLGFPSPCLMLADGTGIPLMAEVSTVGRGGAVSVRLNSPGVSRLHAELIRRGPFLYVSDVGLSRNGTFLNGEPVVQALLTDGDVVSFGGARTRVAGTALAGPADVPVTSGSVTERLVSGREADVLVALCRPAYAGTAFAEPGTAQAIAEDLVVTEAAVKQHLIRLYSKFDILPGPARRTRLANAVIAAGILHRRLCLAVYRPGTAV